MLVQVVLGVPFPPTEHLGTRLSKYQASLLSVFGGLGPRL